MAPAPPSQPRLDALFAAQAARTPDAIGIQHRARLVRYGELAAKANAFAADLADRGVRPGVLVGLCVQRSPDMIALLLAILQAGGAYLPLDARYPPERLAFLLADSGAALLVADSPSPAWGAFPGAVLAPRAGRLEPLSPGRPIAADSAPLPADLAYVIYTSGSTGVPKGVMLGHDAVHLVGWARDFYAPEARAVVAATTALTFDPSVFEMFMPLATGGTVLLKDDALSPFGPDERPTMLDTAPSVLRELCRTGAIPPSVQALNVGGEAVPAALVHAAYRGRPDLALYNHYGPTEATTCATVAHLPRDLVGDPPLGQPVRGARIALLSADGQPCADGEVGEIHIGGPGLALGYLGRPDLTAERFPTLAPSTGLPGRAYRTGDRAFARDGQLYFAGRTDRQVKVRGFRVEPGEIEAALRALPAVDEALVVAREAPSGLQLVAYVETRSRLTPAQVRQHLAATLPGHMAPAQVVVLADFPRLVSGKVDVAALPALAMEPAPAARATRAERPVIHVFEEVLGRAGVGPEQSFFDLGGDSLASVRAALRLEELLGGEVPASLIHQAPTARQLVVALGHARGEAGADQHLSLLQPGGDAPPLFCLSDLFGRPFNYLSLARRLGEARPIYGLSPGPSQAAFTADGDIARLTATFAEEVRRIRPSGPYLIAGYSAGGLLAAALAGHLQRQGAAVRLVLLDAALHSRPPSPRAIARWGWRQARGLLRGGRGLAGRLGDLALALRRAFGRSGSAPPPDWLPPAQIAFAGRMIRLGAAWRPPPFDGPALLLVAEHRDPLDALFDADGLSGWSGVLTGEVTRQVVPGDHHQFLREPQVAATAQAVAAFLAR